MRTAFRTPPRGRSRRAPRISRRPAFENLEQRCVLAFSIASADFFSTGGLRLVADFDQAVNTGTLTPSDLVIDGSLTATQATLLDADTVAFILPALAAGTHSAAIAAGAIQDTQGTALTAFTRSFTLASAAQYTVKHNPRLQPGNAPLVGYAGSELDRVDLLWQTIPGGAGTQDSFTVEYRAAGAAAWQAASLNANIATGVENRVVWSSSIAGLAWNANYEYRVRQRRADVIVNEYQSALHTRLAAGDETSFSFAAYGDAASGAAAGFREVQARINQVNPAFAVLLGDNVYTVGSHPEFDSRLDPVVNPEAAAWMAGHIDYLGMGNHDIGTGAGLPSEQNYSTPIPVAGVNAPTAPPASERPEHNFSFDYGSVHFVTFDTNSLSDTARLDGLLKWVTADLAASTARWKIVYGHHPVGGVPDKPNGPTENYYQQVVNRLQAAGVDLFLVGHSHLAARSYPLTGQVNGVATYANHGTADHFHEGEGIIQVVSGVGGVEIRSGSFSTFPFMAAGFSSTTSPPARLGFSKIDVTPTALTVSYIAADNGQVLDAFEIEKENTQTTSFQQGVNGYTGTVDTFVQQSAPTANNGASTSLKVDGDEPAGSGQDVQALLRFDNLFGSAPGQIPAGATLRSAMLQLQVTNATANNMNLHRLLTPFTAAATWTSLGDGVQTNGAEAAVAPDISLGQAQVGQLSVNVLASLQAWQANPSTNLGWAMIPTGTDGIDFNSSEGATKPKLIVTYVLPTGTNDPPVATADSATTAGNTPVTITVLANDSDPNGDLLTVQSVTTPAHGAAAINAGGTITYTPAAGYFGADSFTYTIADGRGGTASATVSLTVVQTTSFQQGVGSYTGTVDTFVQQNAPAANNGVGTSLNVDSDDPAGTGFDAQSLLRFDSLFGSGAGQIPLTAALQSATLQLQVTNAGNTVNLHRLLANWTGSSTWNSFTDGIQNNGVEAVAAADASTGTVPVGTLTINVLASLQAWQANPSANLGWAFLPTGTDGIDFDSSEGAVKPRLTVSYVPATNTPPTISDIANRTTNEDTSTGVIAFTVGDAETAVGSLIVTATSSNTTLVPSGNLVLGASGANRTLTIAPAANQSGTSTITVTVRDAAGATASDPFVLTVNAVNDVPVAANDTASTTGTTPVTISVLANDTDVEQSPLTASIVTAPASGTATVNANGTITYTPSAGFSGIATFTYRASDGAATSNVATVSVTVTAAATTKFFVVDSSADATFRYQASGAFVSSTGLAAGNTSSRGVATNTAGNTLWVLNSNDVVYVYDAALTLLGSWTATGLTTPTGIAVSGTNVWIADSGSDRVYLYSGATTRRSGSTGATRSFALASSNNNPQDLATDGTTVWVTQSGGTDRVFVYQASNGASLGNWTLGSANSSPVGITLDPTGASQSLWIVDDSADRVFEYASARSRRSGSQTASVSFALNSANGTPQGIADPRALDTAAHDRVFAEGSGLAWGTTLRSAANNTGPTALPLDLESLVADWLIDADYLARLRKRK